MADDKPDPRQDKPLPPRPDKNDPPNTIEVGKPDITGIYGAIMAMVINLNNSVNALFIWGIICWFIFGEVKLVLLGILGLVLLLSTKANRVVVVLSYFGLMAACLYAISTGIVL